jgi:riboflavin biosynthesis pyrimidine reductase
MLVNAAMSADGKPDTVARRGISISSSADKTHVDRLRTDVDAILVVGRTLLDEDPKMTVKSLNLRTECTAAALEENPAKLAVVSLANIKPDGFFLTAAPARRPVYTSRRTAPEQITCLENSGAQVFVMGDSKVDVSALPDSLTVRVSANCWLKAETRSLPKFSSLTWWKN